jgi:predicted dehydrogenase
MTSAGRIGVGLLGTGFMGRAHARALRALCELDPPLDPELVAVCGRDPDRLESARRRYGFRAMTADWRELVGDERVQLFDNGAPNALHSEPTLAAIAAGKHVLCEKPLGRDADEAFRLWAAAEQAGVVAMTGFNYRFVPAVRRAYELVCAGAIGEIVLVRARYLQSWGWSADPAAWRFDRAIAGSGALGDLATHAIDLVRHLAGEIAAVTGALRTAIPERAVDDSVVATLELKNGAVGTLEASRLAFGRTNQLVLELNGTKGSLAYDLERFDELLVSDGGAYRQTLVTGDWWPPGHGLGYGDTFTLELEHLLRAIAGETTVAPLGASFEDGYRACEVADAIARASERGTRVEVPYRRIER